MRRFVQAFTEDDPLLAALPSVQQSLADQPGRYNIGKSKSAAVIYFTQDGIAAVSTMIWGLIPRWSPEPSTPYSTVTARVDRAPKSRIFNQAWRQRRCLVPMSGYFKWNRQHRPPWPHFIQRADGQTLLAAGLWEAWTDDASRIESFSILTGPNASIPAPLTPDGPIFLSAMAGLDWLSGKIDSPNLLMHQALLASLESYPVSRKIKDAELDHYTLLEPVDPDAERAGQSDASESMDEDEDDEDR